MDRWAGPWDVLQLPLYIWISMYPCIFVFSYFHVFAFWNFRLLVLIFDIWYFKFNTWNLIFENKKLKFTDWDSKRGNRRKKTTEVQEKGKMEGKGKEKGKEIRELTFKIWDFEVSRMFNRSVNDWFDVIDIHFMNRMDLIVLMALIELMNLTRLMRCQSWKMKCDNLRIWICDVRRCEKTR